MSISSEDNEEKKSITLRSDIKINEKLLFLKLKVSR